MAGGEAGSARAAVHHRDAKQLVGGQQHAHLCSGGVLGGVRDRLAGEEIGGGQHPFGYGGQRVRADDADLGGRRLGHIGQRRGKALLGEDLRVNPAHGDAQGIKSSLDRCLGLT